MTTSTYKPQKKQREILARALDLVNSVPYQVSARWLFYRLLQEGYYKSKSDYNNKFNPAISKARKAFYGGWRPDTLTDGMREAIVRGAGYTSVSSYLRGLAARAPCVLDKWSGQDTYVELWFEARAMVQQFLHYTSHMTLRPLGGQPSIPYKWEAAKDMERLARAYDVPVVILYFGDLDSAGETIAEVVERDVREWCAVDFQFVHCGLTAEQVQLYGVPENPEKPGEYQWEALTDDAAREIITTHVDPFIRHDAFYEVEQQEQRATSWLRGKLDEVVREWET